MRVYFGAEYGLTVKLNLCPEIRIKNIYRGFRE